MRHLIPKNWSNFQHYKDRAPAWIKLHGDLLDDFEFHCLPLASKALAPMLWLLASKYEGGRIPLDYTKIAFRLRCDAKEVECAVKSLISSGFFIVEGEEEQPASDVLAQCLPREEERREEKRRDAPQAVACSDDSGDSSRIASCPQMEIVDLYNRTLAAKGWVAVNPKFWNGSRADSLRARWREDENRQRLEWWAGWFEFIQKSDWLMGQIPGRDGKPFRGDLEWLVTLRNFRKVCEGKYHG